MLSSQRDFYDSIVRLTREKNYSPAELDQRLEKDSNIVFDLITREYRENIRQAAMSGRNTAYICIYFRDAKYKGSIPIHSFVDMSDKIREKFTGLGLKSVQERLEEALGPFVVSVRALHNCEELKYLDPPETAAADIVIISASWDADPTAKEKKEPSSLLG